MRTLLVSYGLVAVCALPAAAQEARLTQRLDARTAAAVVALVDSARALSLPTEPLAQKALEGASKGASSAVIEAALRAMVHDLYVARGALGADVSAEALQYGAAALDAGLPADLLQRLSAQRARRGLPGALAGLTYLLSRGVPAGAALDIVQAMLQADLTHAEFVSLQRLVDQDVRAGVPSAEAAQVRARALIRHGPRLGTRGGGEA